MIEIVIPGNRTLHLEHLVLDVNGTLALDGQLLPGVAERLVTLQNHLSVHLLTADTHGRQREIDEQLGLQATILPAPETNDPNTQQSRKAAFVEALGAEKVAAMGNGNNDAAMLQIAVLGVAVLGPEGLAGQTLLAADIVCRDITDALDLLIYSDRLRASLRI